MYAETHIVKLLQVKDKGNHERSKRKANHKKGILGKMINEFFGSNLAGQKALGCYVQNAGGKKQPINHEFYTVMLLNHRQKV